MSLFWVKWAVACTTSLTSMGYQPCWKKEPSQPARHLQGKCHAFFQKTSQRCRKGKKAEFCQSREWGKLESTVVSDKQYYVSDQEEVRVYRDLVLDCGNQGEARFTISLPEHIPSEGIPCIIIVGGLKTGRESLQFIPNHGNYALVGYEYPQKLRHLQKIDLLWHFFSVRKTLFHVPTQILSMAQYLAAQPWIDGEPISIMGYSFGSIFVPVTYVDADCRKMALGPGVMAYGGAGIRCLIRANFPGPRWIKSIAANCGEKLFRPIDPIDYAPAMKGNFLMINGIYDTQVPLSCAHCLQDLVPKPKTVINLETQHMSPENTELTLKLIRLSRNWLDENRK
ncbi:MAG: hypothetical protein AAF443_07085 [Chlamydiota bacterium]